MSESPSPAQEIVSGPQIKVIGDLFSLPRYFEMIESHVAGLPREFPFAHLTGPGVALDVLRTLHTYEVEDYFPQLTRYSAVVTIMTLFEDQAHEICEALRQNKSIPVSWTELRGDLLSRFRTYTTKLAGLPPPNAGDWERLEAVNTIRGAIVHANGYARGAWRDRLENLVAKIDGFSIGANGRVRLEAEVWRFAFAVTTKVLHDVHEADPLTSPIFRKGKRA
jgi:hypothetical protein